MAIDPVSKRVHNAWLDWLRFLAAFEVVLTHSRGILFLEYPKLSPESHTLGVAAWTAATRLGNEAVTVFFVLSGFLVGGRAFELARQRKFNLEAYAIDRVVRIKIPLLAAIVLSSFALWWTAGNGPPGLIIGNMLSLQGAFVPPIPVNTPLWTLSYEVWFYITGGAIAFLLSSRQFNLFAAIVLAAAAVIFTRLNALYLLLWFGGAIAYQYRPAIPHWKIVWLGLAFVFAGVISYQLAQSRTQSPVGHPFGLIFGAALMLVGLSLILPNLFVSKWDRGRVAQLGTFLASFSYSLYLIHQPLLCLLPVQDLAAVTWASIGYYIVVVLGLLTAGFIFSRCFETPGPAIKGWLRRRLSRRTASAAATHDAAVQPVAPLQAE